MNVTAEFGGGLEFLFGGKRALAVALEEGSTVQELLDSLASHHIQERRDLFVNNGTVRAGILVLVNESDWELEGGLACPLKDGDRVLFISTLHGG